MLLNKLLCQLLVMTVVVVLYAFSATAQILRLESAEANENEAQLQKLLAEWLSSVPIDEIREGVLPPEYLISQ
jgi:hypothetical protein